MTNRALSEMNSRQRFLSVASILARSVRRHRQDRLNAGDSAELAANRVEVSDETRLSVSRAADSRPRK